LECIHEQHKYTHSVATVMVLRHRYDLVGFVSLTLLMLFTYNISSIIDKLLMS